MTLTPPEAASDDHHPRPEGRSGLALAALGALGVVYGDLGTSPLYTLQTIVQAMGGKFTPESALGVLSMIIWTLIITISVKYCLFVMRADNRGEGGILALMSLVGADSLGGKRRVLTAMGLLGAALIYGDGVITPSISVLSALEGVNVVTNALKPFIMPLAVVILAGLFLVQRFGTSVIGRAFGPVMLVWFVVISILGIDGIIKHPAVFAAVNPIVALKFLLSAKLGGAAILGGVFLCITGGEALYADMGHIGRGPIRFSWFVIVLPALLISYAGQTALLMEHPHVTGNPFWLIAPKWSVYPLVVLSTAATIIASQAIITGSFSMTRQAMQLGWLPGVNIRQTSDRIYGQIYVPVVNWLMMIVTLAITFAFRSSDKLAGAYGTAVSTTMLMTTALLLSAMLRVWKWPAALSIAIAAGFLVVDFAFFSANLLKIAEGGWLPLTLGAVMFLLMSTWRAGIDAVRAKLALAAPSENRMRNELDGVPRTPGTAVFLTRSSAGVPGIILDHVHYVGALAKHVIALTILFEHRPRVPDKTRFSVQPLGEGIVRVTVRFGFVEKPDLGQCLTTIESLPEGCDFQHAAFFVARDQIVTDRKTPRLPAWRLPLFGFMFRNAVKTVDRFNLPGRRVVEFSRQIEI